MKEAGQAVREDSVADPVFEVGAPFHGLAEPSLSFDLLSGLRRGRVWDRLIDRGQLHRDPPQLRRLPKAPVATQQRPRSRAAESYA